MAAEKKTRDDELNEIWQNEKYRFFYKVLGGVILVGIGVLIGMIWFASAADRAAYVVNLYTTFLGVVITVAVIDLLDRRRDDGRAIKDLQEQLVRDAGSASNEIAKNAVHQLRKHGWLLARTGLLRGVNLEGANLEEASLGGASGRGMINFYQNEETGEQEMQGVNLEEADLSAVNMRRADLGAANLKSVDLRLANLEMAHMFRANLSAAKLNNTNLYRARLDYANLSGAQLFAVNLQEADLTTVNFEKAKLESVDLSGADLSHASLKGAIMRSRKSIILNEKTLLPDGSHWTPETDLTKFGVIYVD